MRGLCIANVDEAKWLLSTGEASAKKIEKGGVQCLLQ
jgi:hypothetical protein